MGIKLISSILRLALRNDYYNRFFYFFEILSINITLFIYYFTSQALKNELGGQFEKYQTSYFEYILLGEIFLSIPLFFFEGVFRKVKQAIYDGIWQTISLLQISLIRSVFIISLSGLPKEILRISLTLMSAALFFNLKLNFSALIISFLFTVLFIPLFFSLGLIASAFLIRWGRGQGVVGYINTILNISAGSFFPIAMLPGFIISLTSYSPYTLLLESSRLYYANQNLNSITNAIAPLFLWSLFLVPLSIFIFIRMAKTNGEDPHLRL